MSTKRYKSSSKGDLHLDERKDLQKQVDHENARRPPMSTYVIWRQRLLSGDDEHRKRKRTNRTEEENQQAWNAVLTEEKEELMNERQGIESFNETKLIADRPYKKVYLGSRCSPRSFIDCVAGFEKGKGKIEAVKDVGLGGLLLLKTSKLHREFCLTLLHHFNVEGRYLDVHGHQIHMTPEDVELVMGLPSKGADLVTYGSVEDLHTVRRKYNLPKIIKLQWLEQELKRLDKGDDEFKAKFVLYAIGKILCPVMKLEIPRCYLFSIRDLTKLKEVNWAKVLYDHLLSGIREFQKNKQGSCSGFLPFLNLFYFERICLGGAQAPSKARRTPRISEWDDAKVKQLIKQLAKSGGLSSEKVFVIENGGNQQPNMTKDWKAKEDIIEQVSKIESNVKGLREEMTNNFANIRDELRNMHECIMEIRTCLSTTKKEEGCDEGMEDRFHWDEGSKQCYAQNQHDPPEFPPSNPARAKFNEVTPLGLNKEVLEEVMQKNVEDCFEDEVDRAVCCYSLLEDNDPNEVLCDMKYSYARRKDLQCLNYGYWLFDVVINLVALMLTKKEDNFDLKSQWFLPTHFAQKILASDNLQDKINFVLHSFCNADDDVKFMGGLPSCQRIYIPFNLSEKHWYLCIINLADQEVLILDTSNRKQKRNCKVNDVRKVMKFLDELFMHEWFCKSGLEKQFMVKDFPIISPEWVTRDTSGYDCGMYVIMYMKSTFPPMDVHVGEFDRLLLLLDIIKSEFNSMREIVQQKAVASYQLLNKLDGKDQGFGQHYLQYAYK
ncbi:hypothetical protein REPUB_Repub02eG0036700 [Reevesia pubescens]